MKQRLQLFTFLLLLLISATYTNAQVSVTATAGTLNGSYTTVKGAFDAINLGTHQGAIAISLTGSTTETASAILNSGAIAPAVYSSVNITATTAVTVSGSIVGAIIKLNGADNVTIDGRISGSGRNITVQNTSTSSATAAVWLASVIAGNGCVSNTIRNLELLCGVSVVTSTSITFGIIMSGTTISTTSNGTDNDNNIFTENRIIKCRYGICTRGTTTNLNETVTVTNNTIGASSFGSDAIGKTAILMQADNNALVSGNTIQNIGGDFANTSGGTDRVGIAIGSEAGSQSSTTTITSTNYTVTNNIISNVVEERTFSAVGILIGTTNAGGATNNLVANNMIYGVKANGTAGDYCSGIQYSGGVNDRIVNNSIYMYGDVDPNASASTPSMWGAGINISSANGAPGSNHNNLTLRNNSIHMNLTSSSSSAVRFYAIAGFGTVNPSTYSFGSGGLDFNNYFVNPSNVQCVLGGIHSTTTGATTNIAQFTTLAAWKLAYSVVQDANSIAADPQYISLTDLHISFTSPNLNVGTTIATVTTDIDGISRPQNGVYEIGADELFLQLCEGTPNPGNTLANATSVCVGGTVTLSLQNAIPGIGVTYQWYESDSGIIIGATNPTYNATVTFPSSYYCIVTCSASTFSGTSNPVTINISPNPDGGDASGPSNAVTSTLYNYTTVGSVGNLQWQFATILAGPYSNAPGPTSTSDSLDVSFGSSGTFFFRVKASGIGCPDDFSDTISTVVVLANDNVCDALPLNTGANGQYTNAGATGQEGEPVPPLDNCESQTGWCASSNSVVNSVWFKITPAIDAKYSFSLSATIFDSQFALYEAGACSDFEGFNLLAANDDDGRSGFPSTITSVCLNGGTTYYLKVDGFNASVGTNWGILVGQTAAPIWYADNDFDSYGSPDSSLVACTMPEGYVSNDDDCNDYNNTINPEANEICDEIDNDCDGLTDEGCGCTNPLAHNYDENATMEFEPTTCETCTDGILNGDEVNIDCGGSLCVTCPPPTAVCGNIVTVYTGGGSPVYNGPGASDVWNIPAVDFDAGSTIYGSPSRQVKRKFTNIAFNWTTNGSCVDATPNGVYNNNDKGLVYRDCLPVAPADFNKIRNFDMTISDQFGSSTCEGRYIVINSAPPGGGGSNPVYTNEEQEALLRSLDDDSDFSVFPNPGLDQIFIKTNFEEGVDKSLVITDITGRQVMKINKLQSSLINVDTDRLAFGTYTITMTSGSETKTIKWLKIQ